MALVADQTKITKCGHLHEILKLYGNFLACEAPFWAFSAAMAKRNATNNISVTEGPT